MRNGFKQRIYVFDEFRLDADTLMLYRCDEAVTLPPKVVKTLAVLVEDRGSILSKEELIQKVWEEAVVEESNLSQNLYLLRKTLGSRPDGIPYIETLRRRGYRFNGEVAEMPGLAAEPDQAVAAFPASSRYTYERHGNVVALVDWRDNEAAAERRGLVSVTPVPGDNTPAARHQTLLWALAVIVPSTLIALAFWLNSGRAVRSASENMSAVETVTLTNGDDVAEATMSRDGKYFVYHETDGDYARMVMQQTGQTAKIEVLPKARRSIGAKAFSPDGQFIYFAAAEFGAPHWSIYRVPAMGGVPVKIVEDGNANPSFSPDGRSIVFYRGDWATRRSSLIIAESDGSREKVVLEGRDNFFVGSFPAWSPDGKTIAYGGINLGSKSPGSCTIYTLDLGTGTSRELSKEKWESCYRMEWRRDGLGLVVIGTKQGDADTTRRDQVFMIDAATGESRRVTADPYRKQYSSLAVTDRNEVFCVPFNRSSQIWVMDPNGSAKTANAITTGSSDGKAGLVPLPDGRIAFVARTGDNVGVWMINPDGSDRRQIVSNPAILEELRASPDGKYLFFSSKVDDRNHIYRVDADGSNAKQITEGDGLEIDSSVSPDGKWLVHGSAVPPTYTRRIPMRTSTEGGVPTKISDIDCPVPNLSPTGKFITCSAHGARIQIISAEDGSVVLDFDTVKIPELNIGAKWMPDEKGIVYMVKQKGSTNLWVQPLDGKPARQLTDFPNGDIYNFAFSPDGSKLYLARGLQVHDAVLVKNLP